MVIRTRFATTELIDAANNQMITGAGDSLTSVETCLDLGFDRGYLHRSGVISDLYIDFQRSKIDTIEVGRVSCFARAGMGCYQREELWFCY